MATRRRRQRIGVKYANNGPCKIDDERREKWRKERKRKRAGVRERFKPSGTPFPSIETETWRKEGAESSVHTKNVKRSRLKQQISKCRYRLKYISSVLDVKVSSIKNETTEIYRVSSIEKYQRMEKLSKIPNTCNYNIEF